VSYVPKNDRKEDAKPKQSFGLPDGGFMNSPLVTEDTVYIGDIGGHLYALNRADGKERWKVDTRAKPFPKAHTSNCIFAAPILAGGKLIVAGGGFEHGVAAAPGQQRLYRPRLRRRPRPADRQGAVEVRRRPRAGAAGSAGEDPGHLGGARLPLRPLDEFGVCPPRRMTRRPS